MKTKDNKNFVILIYLTKKFIWLNISIWLNILLNQLFLFSVQAARRNTINNEGNSISLDQLRIKIMYRIRWHKLLHFQRTLLSFLSAINGNIQAWAIREWFLSWHGIDCLSCRLHRVPHARNICGTCYPHRRAILKGDFSWEIKAWTPK